MLFVYISLDPISKLQSMKKGLIIFACHLAVVFVFNTVSYSQSSKFSQAKTVDDCQGALFSEADGILVAEIESITPGAGWSIESGTSGFTGAGYFRWTGGDQFGNPGSGITEYKIKINNPGTYHFRWHSKIMHGTKATESNDSWLRIPDAADFFAKNDTSIKYPKGGMFVQSDSITKGSSKDGWMKVYSSGTTSWTWSCRTSDHDPHEIYASFDTSGIYTVQISGRSNNHALDRFVMFMDTAYSVSEATNKALEETLCASAPEMYTMVVNNGKGGGVYYADSTVIVTADNAPSGKVFDIWTGDTETIDDVFAPISSITIPGSDISITATYKVEETSLAFESATTPLEIFPNPTSSDFFVDLSAITNPELAIYNLSGAMVYQSVVSSGKIHIKNHGLAAGTYILQVSGDNVHVSNMLIIR